MLCLVETISLWGVKVSRIGRKPIEIPEGVRVEIKDNRVEVEGPKGRLSRSIHPSMKVGVNNGKLVVSRSSDSKFHKSLHGLTRSLLANMVEGVTQGFQRVLEINGVGYRADLQGRALTLQLGYSHPVAFIPPEGVDLEVDRPTRVIVRGIDKQLVGQVAAKIRSFRPPDPYKEKGIKYEGEVIRRKAGKVGAK